MPARFRCPSSNMAKQIIFSCLRISTIWWSKPVVLLLITTKVSVLRTNQNQLALCLPAHLRLRHRAPAGISQDESVSNAKTFHLEKITEGFIDPQCFDVCWKGRLDRQSIAGQPVQWQQCSPHLVVQVEGSLNQKAAPAGDSGSPHRVSLLITALSGYLPGVLRALIARVD